MGGGTRGPQGIKPITYNRSKFRASRQRYRTAQPFRAAGGGWTGNGPGPLEEVGSGLGSAERPVIGLGISEMRAGHKFWKNDQVVGSVIGGPDGQFLGNLFVSFARDRQYGPARFRWNGRMGSGAWSGRNRFLES